MRRARLARDARFDGLFFVAVKTTGIYCRPVCPAVAPKEKNVTYHFSAVGAANAGFRPCLRCRPDAAPHSSAWLGTDTSFLRAVKLIDEGALQQGSVEDLADRLGLSSRYVRDLFQRKLGVSPKQYALYRQCLFAKQLLHETGLPITQIAFAAGFGSVRRFNEAIQSQLGLAPSKIRKSKRVESNKLALKLHYRPPFNWPHLFGFLTSRLIDGIEWVEAERYYRTVQFNATRGVISIANDSSNHCLLLELELNDYSDLNGIVNRVRALFDVDAPIREIDDQLSDELGDKCEYQSGLRLPGIWSYFEAGVRAILGQQVSVVQARNMVQVTVQELGEPLHDTSHNAKLLFPTPDAMAEHSLDFLRMPGARKETLRRLAQHFIDHHNPHDVDAWLAIKGIGPWTANYAKLRAEKNPDVWLQGDAGIKNALALIKQPIDLAACQPWRSYLSMQLWHQLNLAEAKQ